MSFMIQQEEAEENFPPPDISSVKKILYATRLFDSYFYDQTKKNKLNSYRMFDLFKDYKFLFQFTLQTNGIRFQSTLIKNNSEVMIQEMRNKMLYWRLIQKYLPQTNLNILLSAAGQFITKKFLFFQQISQKTCLRKQIQEQITTYMIQFIRESVLFYKRLIIKLDQDIAQISKLKPHYLDKQITCINLCNYSFLPTFQMYRKNFNQSDSTSNIFRFNRNSNTDFLKILKRQNFIYHNDCLLQLRKRGKFQCKLSQDENFALEQIYGCILRTEDQISHHINDDLNCLEQQNSVFRSYYKIFISNLDFNLNKKDTLSKEKIYNQIQIINPDKIVWENFQSTAFSHLKIAKIKYINKNIEYKINPYIGKKIFSSNEIYQSTMILKHETQKISQIQKSRMNGQLKWQKKIIQDCFKNQSCVNLPKFFVTSQKIISTDQKTNQIECLLSEFIKKGNLWNWINQHGQKSSIFTKINIILYILYGLSFIHSKKIIHLDLKPMNILMDKNFVPKITDFGSAYNKEVYQKMRKQKIQYFLSFSIPYTAPEIFMKIKKPSLDQKCDMFSIGLIIYEILFNHSIFNQSNENLEKIYKKIGTQLDKQVAPQQKNKVYQSQEIFGQHLLNKIYSCPQNLDQSKSKVYNLLMNCIYRCLSCNEQKRPYLDFLIIAIKQIYKLFIDYYAW